MLAQNFKTPADLGLTDPEFNALRTVLGMLERGEIPHEPKPIQVGNLREPSPRSFNLAHWRCGTAACLGGWAECVGQIVFRRSTAAPGLDRLFFPDDHADEIGADLPRMRAVRPAQAAIALRNYLTHGEPRWAEALSA